MKGGSAWPRMRNKKNAYRIWWAKLSCHMLAVTVSGKAILARIFKPNSKSYCTYRLQHPLRK